MHAGQIILLTKLLSATDLRFYDFEAGALVERWHVETEFDQCVDRLGLFTVCEELTHVTDNRACRRAPAQSKTSLKHLEAITRPPP